MQHTQSATELSTVLVEPLGAGANVWLRQNITTVEIDLGDGLSQQMWEADEVSGMVEWVPTAEEIEEDFESWWDTFERASMSVAARIAEVYAMTERAQAQADFTAIMTDTEVM